MSPTLPADGPIEFRHVDVFTDHPFSGNGLIVMFCQTLSYSAGQLRTVTEEMRQFETIFVAATDQPHTVEARIFTAEEELPFAGHPVVGAAAAVHERLGAADSRVDWQFAIGDRVVPVVTRRDAEYFTATMDQGPASFPSSTAEESRKELAVALNLTLADLRPLPLQVVSTGLPYLIVPVTTDGLRRAKVAVANLGSRLTAIGAKFVYVLDTEKREGRTWDNAGTVEDIATGSAAGPAAAYLHAHGLAGHADPVQIAQGQFVGRPSTITVARDADGHLWVGGPVRPVATGRLTAMPSVAAER